ncbi:unnamed protein product, partial [Mesorhabditis spiculigera]
MSREGNETLHRCKLAEHNYRHRKWKRLFLLVEVISFLGAVSLTGDLLYRFGWVYLAETFSKQDRLLLVIFAVMAMYGNAIFVVMKLVGVSKKYPEPLTIFFVVGDFRFQHLDFIPGAAANRLWLHNISRVGKDRQSFTLNPLNLMASPTAEIDDVAGDNFEVPKDAMDYSEYGNYVVHSCDIASNRVRYLFLKFGFFASIVVQGLTMLGYIGWIMGYIGYFAGPGRTHSGQFDEAVQILNFLTKAGAFVMFVAFLGLAVQGVFLKRSTLLWMYLIFQVTCTPLTMPSRLTWSYGWAYHGQIPYLSVLQELGLSLHCFSAILAFLNIKAMETCPQCY